MLMRWNSADPLFRFAPDLEPEEPLRLNLYAFSGNNPVQFVDPDGRNWATDAYHWTGNHVVPRVIGAAKVVGGGAVFAVGVGLCETGLGCLAGGPLMVGAADVAGSGVSEAIYGAPAQTAVGATLGPRSQEFEEGLVNAAGTVSAMIDLAPAVLARVRAARASSGAAQAAKASGKAGLRTVAKTELQTVHGGNSPPTLPEKVIVDEGGVRIEHYYRSGDHGPAHAHVIGGGKSTKIGPKGYPLPGNPKMTSVQQSVYDANKPLIRQAINKIGRWLNFEGDE